MFKFLLARLTERSTWLGITAFASAAGISIAPELTNGIATAGTAAAGVILSVTEG